MKLFYLLFILSFSAAFLSCSNNQNDSYSEWRQKNEKFIDERKNDPSFLQTTIPQGPGIVYYKVINEAVGDTCPLYTSQVKVHYKGHLIDDYVFDNEKGHFILTDKYVFDDASERTITMYVNSNISGFAVALQNMKRGNKWEIYIPWELGYGSSGLSSSSISILPYSALIFEIELVGISQY